MREKVGANHAYDDDDGDRWFTLEELARYSSLSVRTLSRYLKDPARPLPHHRVGAARGRIVVGKRRFDQWMEQFRVGRPTDPDDASWVRRGLKH